MRDKSGKVGQGVTIQEGPEAKRILWVASLAAKGDVCWMVWRLEPRDPVIRASGFSNLRLWLWVKVMVIFGLRTNFGNLISTLPLIDCLINCPSKMQILCSIIRSLFLFPVQASLLSWRKFQTSRFGVLRASNRCIGEAVVQETKTASTGFARE